jgi:hypothetical protein
MKASRESDSQDALSSVDGGSVRQVAGKRTLTEWLPVQHKLQATPAAQSGGAETHALAASGVSGAGHSLPHLDRIQRLFGSHDVSGIRAHTDVFASSANAQMGAEGFAIGRDVGFASSSPSLHTAAHEAAHVVQQRAGVQLKGGVGDAGDAYEQQADRVADLVVQGRSAERELSQLGGATGVAPVVQHKLKLTGTAAHIQRALAVMNRGLFGFTARVDASGFVTLVPNGIQGPPTPRQSAMYNYLSTIINDTKTTSIGVEASTDTLVGSYATSRIDIADIEAMTGGTGATDVGSLLHELVEQYHKQVKSTGYGGETSGAHHEGILAENAVNGATRGPQRVVTATPQPDGTIDATVEIPYTYPNGRVVTTTLTIVRNNVTRSVDRETTPARTP